MTDHDVQDKSTSPVVSDAAVKEDLAIPAQPTDQPVSDEDLNKVAGGFLSSVGLLGGSRLVAGTANVSGGVKPGSKSQP
jgi:hypothetical protein